MARSSFVFRRIDEVVFAETPRFDGVAVRVVAVGTMV